MYCKKCGNLMGAEEKFCMKCGEAVEQVIANIETLDNNIQTPIPSPIQPSMTNNNFATNSEAQINPKKSSSPILMIVIALLCILVIVLGVLYFTQNKETNAENTQVVLDSTTKVNYSGYTFSIPTNYISDSGEYLSVYDDTEEWISNIGIYTDLAYVTIKNKMSELKGALESTGITVNSIQEKTINGNSWIIFEYVDAGYNVLGGYGATSNNKVVSLEIANADNQLDNERFNEFEKICSSAKISTNKGATDSTTNKGVLSELAETLK